MSKKLCWLCGLVACVFMSSVRAAPECTAEINVRERWNAAHFRTYASTVGTCTVSEARYVDVVARWLQRDENAGVLTSLSLGRAIHYPWITNFMVETTATQHGLHGQVDADVNQWVVQMLSTEDFLQRLNQPFKSHKLNVCGIRAEKVLVKSIPTATGATINVPYDALIWLSLCR